MNILSKTDCIQNIRNRLSGAEYAILSGSQFGPLLDFRVRRMQHQVLHGLLKRHVLKEDTKELWFNVGGKIAVFGIREFALTTGLNCEDYPKIRDEDYGEGEVLTKIFRNKKKITKKDVENSFNRLGDKGQDINVKIAKLYLLECYVLGRQENIKIDLKNILLVDNGELFENYPWGRLSYEMTIKSFVKALSHSESSAILLNGFPYALLIWAYETFPQLSREETKYVQKIGDFRPRMLNWETCGRPDVRLLDVKIFDNKEVEMKILEPTKEEKEEEYMTFFCVPRRSQQYATKERNVGIEGEENYVEEIEEYGVHNLLKKIKKVRVEQKKIMDQNEEIKKNQEKSNIILEKLCAEVLKLSDRNNVECNMQEEAEQ